MNIENVFHSHKKLIIGGILIVLLLWFWSSSGDSDAGSSGSVPMSVEECEESNMAGLNQEFANPNSDFYQAMAQCVEKLHKTVEVTSLKCTDFRIALREGRSEVTDFDKDVAAASFVVVATWDGLIHKGGSTAILVNINMITAGMDVQVLRSSALITVTPDDLKKMGKWLLGTALKTII